MSKRQRHQRPTRRRTHRPRPIGPAARPVGSRRGDGRLREAERLDRRTATRASFDEREDLAGEPADPLAEHSAASRRGRSSQVAEPRCTRTTSSPRAPPTRRVLSRPAVEARNQEQRKSPEGPFGACLAAPSTRHTVAAAVRDELLRPSRRQPSPSGEGRSWRWRPRRPPGFGDRDEPTARLPRSSAPAVDLGPRPEAVHEQRRRLVERYQVIVLLQARGPTSSASRR